MPAIEWFPYFGPNRRSDKTVIEITLKFDEGSGKEFPQRVSDIRDPLVDSGILAAAEKFPEQTLPDERNQWYSSLLVQTALLFQRKAGHRVSFFSVIHIPEKNQCTALLEHEHCDVGMTAVKLAVELLNGQRRLLTEPFRMFNEFARARLLPLETGAIIRAARARDIPAIHLERQPYTRDQFNDLTGGKCICPNGLLMLGHGKHQHVLDGTYCLDKSEGFDMVPDLAGTESASLDSSADALLDWLFPDTDLTRMPIIAITGTNGKTTTTRMINHVLKHAGHHPGMVCTNGIYLDGEQLVNEDKSTRTGHLKILTSKAADVAVLETHHRGLLDRGFAFRWCDIGICLNVTDDHIGELGIDTVAQMAEIKTEVPKRARHAAILNADDPHCLAMTAIVTAEITCLVSMVSTPEALTVNLEKPGACFCVLEQIQNEEWVVIQDHGKRLPVVATSRIPATFEGTARFNVSNAMHAIAACYLSGTEVDVICEAMSRFKTGYETTPGRMNEFTDLPFRIILDFAHNPDGIRRIAEFADKQEVEGRKIVAFAGTRTRPPALLKNMGRALAGHFDFYFCKEHAPAIDRPIPDVAHLLQQGLLESGVPEDQIAVRTYGKDLIFEIFDACEPGDLLLMLIGYVEMHQLPAYIEEYVQAYLNDHNA